MKIDLDLVRELLLVMEPKLDGFRNYTIEYIAELLPGSDYKTVYYHIHYLAKCGFLEVNSAEYIIDLTPAGHQYLNKIRNKQIWNKVKKIIQPLGNISFSVISNLVTELVSKTLGS